MNLNLAEYVLTKCIVVCNVAESYPVEIIKERNPDKNQDDDHNIDTSGLLLFSKFMT